MTPASDRSTEPDTDESESSGHSDFSRLPLQGVTSSLARALEILDLLSLSSPVLKIEDVVTQLGYTRSTAYRYVRELCDAGLLAQRLGGTYSLGPRIIELERLLELTDPLYRAGRTVLPSVPCEGGMLMLQEIYRDDQVMCIYKEGPDELEYGGRRISIRRARGLPLPLFRGAASLAVLAWLSPYRIKQSYLSNTAQIAQAGLGSSWEHFRAFLTQIRKQGYAVSKGLVVPEVVGVGVPVLLPADKRVIGSLSYALARPDLTKDQEIALAAQLRAASQRIAQEYLHELSN